MPKNKYELCTIFRTEQFCVSVVTVTTYKDLMTGLTYPVSLPLSVYLSYIYYPEKNENNETTK